MKQVHNWKKKKVSTVTQFLTKCPCLPFTLTSAKPAEDRDRTTETERNKGREGRRRARQDPGHTDFLSTQAAAPVGLGC